MRLAFAKDGRKKQRRRHNDETRSAPASPVSSSPVSDSSAATRSSRATSDDWGHFSISEDSETTETVDADGGSFESGRFGSCGSRCAERAAVRAPPACAPRTTGLCAADGGGGRGTGLAAHGRFRLRLPGAADATFDAKPTRGGFACAVRRRRAGVAANGPWEAAEHWVVRGGGHEALELSPRFAPRAAVRSFDEGARLTLAGGGVRVVATPFERYAQYELRYAIDGGDARVVWRRYSAFRAFVRGLSASHAPREIVRTVSAWADAEDAKKVFRCTHPAYLLQRAYHFEAVLREALFEVETQAPLLAFLAAAPPVPAPPGPPRSRPVAVYGGASEADAASVAGTPAIKDNFLSGLLGIREVSRIPATAH